MSRPTKKQTKRFALVASLGCIIPGCCNPPNIHHSRDGMGMGQRSHDQVIPICKWHHQDGPFARHKDPAKFAELHGTDSDLLEMVSLALAE